MMGELPSATSAAQLLKGEPGALITVVFHTLARAGIIGTGLYVAGQRKGLAKSAVYGSLAVEAFVLAWVAMEKP